MKGKIGDKQRLGHILEAIAEIESYTSNTVLQEFLGNSMMRFASIKQIEIIGRLQIISLREQSSCSRILSGGKLLA